MLHIIVGSENDLKYVGDSKVMEIITAMRAANIRVVVSVISADRNRAKLDEYCRPWDSVDQTGIDHSFDVVVAAAGMAAVLPSAIAAAVKFDVPVIGVPLPSPGFENCLDSTLAMLRKPSGCPVLVVDNMQNALLAAWKIIAMASNAGDAQGGYEAFMAAKSRKVKINIFDAELTGSVGAAKK